jgi:cytochrome c oxidase assembly protein subunit 15
MTSTAQAFLRRGLPMVTATAENPYAPVGKWILGTAGLVVGMIHVGGVTRLTQSGLSMTTWTPLGSLPPITRDQWEEEFARYKNYPEWQQRKSMTLDEFRFIYGWEYGHRMLGRFVGIAFLVPWLAFTMRGKIPKGYQGRMVGLLAMGGAQGVVGWWMVKSGLGDDRRTEKKEVRVRPIRLASHLSMALVTYGALLWTGLDILGLKYNNIPEQISKLSKEALRHASRLRTGSLVLAGLTAVTVSSGALVAGNDAGRAFNTYPMMDGQWIPSDILELVPWHRNVIENTATVQWNHRMLGTTTAITALSLLAVGLGPNKAALLTPQARNGLYAVGIAATGQMALGITTLLMYVPIELAAAHQIGSIVVFTSSIYLAHSLRYARPAMLRAANAMTKSNPKVVSDAALAAKAAL